jgi:YHS domain-containing protein
VNPAASSAARRPAVPSGGELKKDPVCGTFISASTAIQKKSGGEVYYFCSPECRDKFRS